MDFLKLKLAEYGFALVVGPLAAFVFQLLKRYSYWIDSLKAWPKRAFVTVTVAAFVAFGSLTGVDFGVTADAETLDFLANVDIAALKTALGAGAAFLLHWLHKSVKK